MSETNPATTSAARSDDTASELGSLLHNFALRQIKSIDEHLKRRGRRVHRAVHETRKAIRRLRAVLTLCDSADSKAIKRVIASVRAVGKSLSRLRDAHVIVQTATTLSQQGAHPAEWGVLVQALKERRDEALKAMQDIDPHFRGLRGRIGRAGDKLGALNFAEITSEEIVLALRHSAARMRSAERDANETPTVHLRHRWRRRVRHLRYQLEILQEIARSDQTPSDARIQTRWVLNEAEETMPSAQALVKLTTRLGAQQDLVALKNVLRKVENLPHREMLSTSVAVRAAQRSDASSSVNTKNTGDANN